MVLFYDRLFYQMLLPDSFLRLDPAEQRTAYLNFTKPVKNMILNQF